MSQHAAQCTHTHIFQFDIQVVKCSFKVQIEILWVRSANVCQLFVFVFCRWAAVSLRDVRQNIFTIDDTESARKNPFSKVCAQVFIAKPGRRKRGTAAIINNEPGSSACHPIWRPAEEEIFKTQKFLLKKNDKKEIQKKVKKKEKREQNCSTGSWNYKN